MKTRIPGTVIEISLHETWTTVEFKDDSGNVCVSVRCPVLSPGETIVIPLRMEMRTCVDDHTTSTSVFVKRNESAKVTPENSKGYT